MCSLKMEVLPYITPYLLLYSFALNFLFWFMPAPYGKFSYQEHTITEWGLMPSWWFNMLSPAAFGVFYGGWLTIEDGTWEWHGDYDKKWSDRSIMLFVILNIYFVHRVLAQLIYNSNTGIQKARGSKQVHLVWLIAYWLFWAPAGMYWRRTVETVDVPLELYDIVLCLLAFIFWALNVYSDYVNNKRRCEDDVTPYEVIGKYLTIQQIHSEFASIERLYHVASLPPNYTFEIAFWFVFIFLSRSWEGLWWWCCIFMFLFTRGVWQKTWYHEPVDKGEKELMMNPFPPNFNNE